VFLTLLSSFTCFRRPPGRRENRRLFPTLHSRRQCRRQPKREMLFYLAFFKTRPNYSTLNDSKRVLNNHLLQTRLALRNKSHRFDTFLPTFHNPHVGHSKSCSVMSQTPLKCRINPPLPLLIPPHPMNRAIWPRRRKIHIPRRQDHLPSRPLRHWERGC
jgi:hypothetical protein